MTFLKFTSSYQLYDKEDNEESKRESFSVAHDEAEKEGNVLSPSESFDDNDENKEENSCFRKEGKSCLE
jgi:hypothetical protein